MLSFYLQSTTVLLHTEGIVKTEVESTVPKYLIVLLCLKVSLLYVIHTLVTSWLVIGKKLEKLSKAESSKRGQQG